MHGIERAARWSAVAAALVLAGCEAREEPAATPVAAEPAASAIVAPAPAIPPDAQVASLAGEWRVAGIDGKPLDEPYGLALSGDSENLWWEPKCAAMWRTYRIDGGTIEFGFPAHFRQPDGATPPVCVIAVPPALSEAFEAIDAAETIERTPENGILISGGGRSLTLFSQ